MQPSEPAYPAFDTAKPTDAERIAELEARVTALEARERVFLDMLETLHYSRHGYALTDWQREFYIVIGNAIAEIERAGKE